MTGSPGGGNILIEARNVTNAGAISVNALNGAAAGSISSYSFAVPFLSFSISVAT